MPTLEPGHSDPLSAVLHSWRLQSSFTCRSTLTGAWGLTLPAVPGAVWFHVVTAGRCVLAAGGEQVAVEAGGVVLVHAPEPHTMWSDARAPRPDVRTLPHRVALDRYAVLEHGTGEGPVTTLVCGVAHLEAELARAIARTLPPLLPVQGDGWLRATVELVAHEADALRPGGETITTRLAEVVVVQAIRGWLARPDAPAGWAAALADPGIGRAIARIHQDPGQAWTVAGLAREAAMSRSAFAARFATLVGEPPLQYVTRQRMAVAERWLREQRLGVGDVADRMGYRSEAAFRRAFKRFTGAPPGRARAG